MKLLKVLLTTFCLSHVYASKSNAASENDFMKIDIDTYKRVDTLYDICWNGSAVFDFNKPELNDILRSKHERTPDESSFNQSIEKEINYKTWMANMIYPRLYRKGKKTKALKYIERNVLSEFNSLNKIFESNTPENISLRVKMLKLFFERCQLARKEIFFGDLIDAGENYSDIKKHLIANPDFKRKRTYIFEFGQEMSVLEPSAQQELLNRHNSSFSQHFLDVFKTVSFQYYLISICFPDTFFTLLKHHTSAIFVIEKALDDAEFASLSLKMRMNKKEKIPCETNAKIFKKNQKTGKYIHSKIKYEEDIDLIRNDLIEKMTIENRYFSPIIRSFIKNNNLRTDNTSVSDLTISEKKLNIEESVLKKMAWLEKNPTEKYKLFFENYYLLRKQRLIDIISDGKEKSLDALKIRSFNMTSPEMKIKHDINQLLESNDIIFHILNGSVDSNMNQTLEKAFKNFEKTASDVLYDLQAKYLYRFLVLEQYYPGKISSAKERILSDFKEKISAKEKAEAERDRLIQELLDADSKKKKAKKNPPKKKEPSKSELIKIIPSKNPNPPVIETVEKKESPLVKNAQKKQPQQSTKHSGKVIPPKQPGNQNKPKKIRKELELKKQEQKQEPIKNDPKKNIEQPNIIIIQNVKEIEKEPLKAADISKNPVDQTQQEQNPTKKRRKKKKKTQNQSNIIIISDTKEEKKEVAADQELFFDNDESTQKIQKDIDQLSLKLEDVLNINQYLQSEINLKKEECYYLEQENNYIKTQKNQILSYLRYIQNLKKEQNQALKNDFKNIKKFIAENDAEQIALNDSQNLVHQANMLSQGSYDVFYQGIDLMNNLLVERVSLIEEIKSLIVEKNNLTEELSLNKKKKEPVFQHNSNYEEKKSFEKPESFFSRAKKKGDVFKKTIEGVSAFLKTGNIRDFSANILRSRLQSLLTDNKKLTSTLRAQLEYTDKKFPKLIQKNIQIKNQLFDIQKRYSTVMARFHEESYAYPIKIQNFYEKQMLQRVSTQAKRQEFLGAVNYFHQVNLDFSAQMSALDGNIQTLYADLNKLSHQRDMYYAQKEDLKHRLASGE